MLGVSKGLLRECDYLNNCNEHFSYLNGKSTSGTEVFALHFAHATGFNAETYQPIFLQLLNKFNIYAMDFRGHGKSRAIANPNKLKCWTQYRDDLITFLDNVPAPLILAGHSMGAIVSILTAVTRPERVKALILVEPTFVNPVKSKWLALGKYLGLGSYFPIAQQTRKRRYRFPSADLAVENYIGRGIFSTWETRFIQHYVRGGMRSESRDSVVLTCDPCWESQTYATLYHKTWNAIRKIKCPILVLYGGRNSTVDNSSILALRKYAPQAVYKKFPLASHFLPMEYPLEIINEINQFSMAL